MRSIAVALTLASLLVLHGCQNRVQEDLPSKVELGEEPTAAEIVSAMDQAYKDLDTIACTGSQSVANWSTEFTINLDDAGRFLYWCKKSGVEDDDLVNAQAARRIDNKIEQYMAHSKELKYSASIREAISPPSIGEGPYFVLERVFSSPDFNDASYAFPNYLDPKTLELKGEEKFEGTDCYILMVENPGMNMYPGGITTIWVSKETAFVHRVLDESYEGMGGSMTRDTVFSYGDPSMLTDKDFEWPSFVKQ